MQTPVTRRIAALVLLTFTSLTLQPLQAAAQWQLAQAKATQTTPPSDDEQVAQLLDAIKDTAKRGADKARQGQKTRDEAKAIRTLKRQLDALEGKVDEAFAATEADLITKNLPAEILARHRSAVTDYRAKQSEFKRQLKTLEDADEQDNEPGRANGLTSLSTWLAQNQKSKPHTKTDPNKLPFRTPDAKVRAPIESEAGYQGKLGLFGVKPLHLAGPIPAGTRLTPQAAPDPYAPPGAADLAETEDIQLTPAIRAKAAELLNNPVKIHNWVRNNIEYLPTYGSIQGSDMTLQTKRGNAFDTASLEIALLRAANIPARYVYGAIELPVEQAMNWVGGVTRPEAALNLLAQGGIPSIGLVSGGQISHVKMEHVWVEAYVDYIPSRGAVNRNPNTWTPLDGSFKQYAYTQGMDIKSTVPLDAASLLAQAQSGATVNQAEGWVQNLNQANIQNALTSYQAQVQSYVTSQNANATVGDVLGTKTIAQKNYSILMGTLPYKTLATGSRMSSLPDSLRWKIKLNLYTSEIARANQAPQMSVVLNMSAIGTKRLAATYVPSSDSDAQVIKNYGTATKLPLYLVNQTLDVYLDEQKLAEYQPQRMGADQFWTYTLVIPGGGQVEEDFKFASAVGDQVVFGVNGGGLSFEQAASRYATVNPNSPLENLQHLSLGYWARADVAGQILAGQYHSVSYRLPSVGMFTQPVSVIYSWGTPWLGSYKSYAIDIRRLTFSAMSVDGRFPSDYVFQTGITSSFLEGRIFEEIFDYAPGNGFSAAAVIATAIHNGVPVWKITADNLQLFLAKAIVSEDVKQEIANAVNAGMTVYSAEEGVDVGFWAGQGYITTDPATGSGAYILHGANGGEFEACEEKSEPLTQSISSQILTFTAIALAAILIATSGGLDVPVIVIAMRMVGITTLTWSSTSYAAGKCGSDEKCHRGSIQAQGRDIDGPGTGTGKTKSEKWAQLTPLTLSQGVALLDALIAKLTINEANKRSVQLVKAREWMQKKSYEGGACQPGAHFGGVQDDSVRVDIVINAGTAFVP